MLETLICLNLWLNIIKCKEGNIVKSNVMKTVYNCEMPFYKLPFRFGNRYVMFKIRIKDIIIKMN